MKHNESNLRSFDGLQLYVQSWEPKMDPLAVVCLVHGMGEHSGRYAHLANYLNQSGYALITFDLRGHGKSEGLRCHIPSFDAYMEDIQSLLAFSEKQYPGLPQFLYGHSLGGILALNYVLRRKPQLAGVIVTSPGLRTTLEKQTLKVAMAKAAGAILPTFGLPNGLEVEAISRDPQVVKKYSLDPLVQDTATLGWARQMLPALPWTFDHASEFHLPLLMMHGTADRVAFSEGSQEFASKVSCDCTLKLWDGLYHELHNEPEKQEVLYYLVRWLEEKRIRKPVSS